MQLFWVAIIVFIINIPFGYWRANTKKFSIQWVFAIHLPIPLIIALRYLTGIGWQWVTFPALIVTFFLGQLAGGLLNEICKIKCN